MSKTAAETPAMKGATKMPLFYSKPTPLDPANHGKFGLKRNFDLSFAAGVNAVPLNMIELPQACHHYPIAFSPDEHATPVALLGVRDNENLFVNDKGEWDKDVYVPAYVRRYPFIFSEVPGQDKLTLCVDMNERIINEKAEQKFFDGTQPSQLSQNALEFCKSYHAAAKQTFAFGQALAKSGLLVERVADVNIGSGKRISFSGFKIIDEQKLADMKDSDFLEWRKNGWLPFLYAHLFSGAQWQNLTHKLRQRMEKDGSLKTVN